MTKHTPWFSCACPGCAAEISYPLDMLAEWNGEWWCNDCYDEATSGQEPWTHWMDLPRADPTQIELPKGYKVVQESDQ